MTEIIRNLIGSDLWATLIMSIFPLIELKGGIVFARGAGFDFLTALGLAYFGSTMVFIPIYFLLRPILNLMKKIKWFNKLALKVEDYFGEKAQSAVQKGQSKGDGKNSENFYKKLGVFIFVAIPLPMTGVWMGTAIAVFFSLKVKDAILPVVVGNVIAGLIISLLAQVCLALWTIAVLDYILYALFAIAVVMLALMIVKVLKQKTKTQNAEEVNKD